MKLTKEQKAELAERLARPWGCLELICDGYRITLQVQCVKPYTPADKARMEKSLGKRFVAKDPWFNKTFISYDMSWPSGKAAIAHLCRVCDSVQLAPNAEESQIAMD